MSLNSGEARIIGGWGGIYIYLLYALWNEAREEGVSFVQEADHQVITCKFTPVEPVMPSTHLGELYTFNFSIQLKSLQGLIATIVGYVAVPFI